MNSKIVTLKTASKIYRPNSITLVSGSFEPFNVYYFEFLRWSSKNRPLVVIVQKDAMVMRRRGFSPLSSTHRMRADIIAALEFVDQVVIMNTTAHDPKCIKLLKPKIIIFQNDNIKYRKALAREIREFNPEIHIKYAPFRRDDSIDLNREPVTISANKKYGIQSQLLRLSTRSKGRLSKISALLVNKKGAIVLESANSLYEEHAEILLIKKAKLKHIDLSVMIMYILIPPCIMCARSMLKNGIKKILYLWPYGDMQGVYFLNKEGVTVERYRANAPNES